MDANFTQEFILETLKINKILGTFLWYVMYTYKYG